MALATIDGSNGEAVRRVEAALHDSDARVRQQAALALGQMKATSAIPALKEALDDHGEVAFAAAKALTDLGDPVRPRHADCGARGRPERLPGMMTNAIREAQRRVKHPAGTDPDGRRGRRRNDVRSGRHGADGDYRGRASEEQRLARLAPPPLLTLPRTQTRTP